MKTMYIANRCDGISKEELEHMKTSDLQDARTQLILGGAFFFGRYQNRALF